MELLRKFHLSGKNHDFDQLIIIFCSRVHLETVLLPIFINRKCSIGFKTKAEEEKQESSSLEEINPIGSNDKNNGFSVLLKQ